MNFPLPFNGKKRSINSFCFGLFSDVRAQHHEFTPHHSGKGQGKINKDGLKRVFFFRYKKNVLVYIFSCDIDVCEAKHE